MLSALPILGDQGPVVLTIDGAVASSNDAQPTAVLTAASHDVGRTLGLRLLAGTWWNDGARDVAVVTSEAARRYFGGVEQAIGRRVAMTQGDRTGRSARDWRVERRREYRSHRAAAGAHLGAARSGDAALRLRDPRRTIPRR